MAKRSKKADPTRSASAFDDPHRRWELLGSLGLLCGSGSGRTVPRLSESQIAYLFQHAGEGTPLAEICESLGISGASYFNWRRRFGGLMSSELDYVKELQAEVFRLRSRLEYLERQKSEAAV